MPKRGSYHRYICMFLIYLIIIPVIHTANVFAYFNADIHGYNNIPNFRKSTSDITIINVSASIPGETILPSQVKVISDPTRPFDCSAGNISEPVICELRIPGDLPPGPHDYEVQLFKADMSEAEPKQILTVYADGIAPTIHSFGLQRNGSDIQASYQVSDRACEACPPDICAGVGRIEFLLNYEKVGEVLPETGSCLIPLNSTKLDIAPIPGTTTKTICIDAYDRLDQRSSECMEIVMDFSSPKLINASLWLGDFPLKYTKGEPIGNAKLQAYISEESELNISSIVADFSNLNSRAEYSDAYKSIDMSRKDEFDIRCENESEGIYRCEWNRLLIILSSTATPEVAITANDSLGNQMDDRFTIPILFDNTRPVIDAIRSGIADERGRYWVGKGNNTIYVDMTEEGSGFNDKKLFLDFSSFGMPVLFPNECTEGWTCTFYNVDMTKEYASGSVLTVPVVGTSADDANNLVEGITTAGFYFDAEAPQIISVQNSTICPTAPDSIDFIIEVSERYSGGVKAAVSAPELSSSVFPQIFDCEETGLAGIWTCDITIDNLASFYVDGTINVTLEDRAGNKETTTLYQEVCEAAPGTPPNVISTTGCDILPAIGIDRQISEKIPFPIFVRPTLKPISQSASIQQIRVENCVSPHGTFSDYYILNELELEKPLIGTKVQLSSEALGTGNATSVDSMDIECELHLIVRAGTKVYQEPEIETVKCEDVPIHGTAFGGIDESLAATLEDLEDQIESKENEIDDYEGWLKVLGTFCTLGEIMAKLSAALQILREVIWLVSYVLYKIDATKPAGESLYYMICRISEWVTALTMSLLWNIDSNILFSAMVDVNGQTVDTLTSPGFYFKILCGLFTCRLTEQNTIVELLGGLFVDWGPANERSYSKFVEEQEVEGGKNRFPEGEGPANSIPADVYKVVFSAYRSKEMTNAFLCMPGYVYALRKERQLLCMKRNCYRDYVAAGFSPEICDRMHAGRHCLYVTSAAYKVSGDDAAGRIALGIFEYILTQTIGSSGALALRKFKKDDKPQCAYPYGILKGFVKEKRISEGVKSECGKDKTDSPSLKKTKYSHLCGLTVAVFIWMDVGDWFDMGDLQWNYYNKKLGDPDYCSGWEEEQE